eukprot:654616-Amphidinium_carterae.1
MAMTTRPTGPPASIHVSSARAASKTHSFSERVIEKLAYELASPSINVFYMFAVYLYVSYRTITHLCIHQGSSRKAG